MNEPQTLFHALVMLDTIDYNEVCRFPIPRNSGFKSKKSESHLYTHIEIATLTF